ncbi:hypothetical protein F4779DRAFT_497380 [Xylariaceae sp. FL0662B]|nr:hypothetical protein F4779DRAFT_497380 [Xylariaceae sp. FL0662B]
MALVNYSSSDSESESEPTAKQEAPTAQAVKRRKTSLSSSYKDGAEPEESALPPLPAAFHDLYASTVRMSTTDDPTLHQGRKRVNPHRVGSWPSHLYIELQKLTSNAGHPTPSQLTTLTTLLSTIQSGITSTSFSSSSSPTTPLNSLLTSDLGAPLPLHISLSRPIVLPTSQKAAFLTQTTSHLRHSGVSPFAVSPYSLSWHRGSSASARSFLVLRVASSSSAGAGAAVKKQKQKQKQNPELTRLLDRCNDVVRAFAQPPLYASAAAGEDGDDGGDGDEGIAAAFHISLAWTLGPPADELVRATEAAFAVPGVAESVRDMCVRVDGVKVKIGNAVTHVGLPRRGRRDDSDSEGGNGDAEGGGGRSGSGLKGLFGV